MSVSSLVYRKSCQRTTHTHTHTKERERERERERRERERERERDYTRIKDLSASRFFFTNLSLITNSATLNPSNNTNNCGKLKYTLIFLYILLSKSSQHTKSAK